MRIQILASALNDLADGFRFYENQQQGLGGYFLDALSSDIDSLRLYAGIHLVVFGYHRLLAKRFPYAVYYFEGLRNGYCASSLGLPSGPVVDP